MSSSIPGNQNFIPVNTTVGASDGSTAAKSKQSTLIPSPRAIAASSTQKLEPGNIIEVTEKIRAVAKAVEKKSHKLLKKKFQSTPLAKAIKTLKKIENYHHGKRAAFSKDFLKVQMGEFGTASSAENTKNTFLYVSYDENTNKIQVVFDKNVPPSFKAGAFKKVRPSYQFSPEEEIKSVMVTKQNIETELNRISTRREKATYKICKEAGITEGIPKIHTIGVYTSHKGIEKQIIIQDFITGGMLEDALNDPEALNDHERLNIAVKLAEILSKFHSAGLSHNDLKPGNVMLDAKKNPILIDFGATTNPKDNQLIGGSLGYFPPELGGNQVLLDKYNAIRENVDLGYDEMEFLQEIINDKTSKPEFVNNASVDIITCREKTELLEKESSEVLKVMKSQISSKDWVPKKNDDYAFGVILKELFDNNSNFENGPVRNVINGLLSENPKQRMTCAEAFVELRNL